MNKTTFRVGCDLNYMVSGSSAFIFNVGVVTTGLIRLGTGHDAADTSFATIFGPATFTSMKVTMELQEGPAPIYTTDAISTS